MRLYHFTSLFHLDVVQEHGLSRGDVPVSPFEGMNAVWLTTNPSKSSQNWKEGSAVDKTKVRITVEIQDSDPNLHKWSEFAKQEQVPDWWYKALHETGGKGSDEWYIYEGVIPSSSFVSIDQLED